jgi:NADP-dependent 3-hydroxy acid dehydrogenase YdfG
MTKPVALITGATRGIGAAIARALADSHYLILGGRDAETLKTQAALYPSASIFVADLEKPETLAAAVDSIGSVDVVIHNAGITEVAQLSDTSLAYWHRVLTINVVAVAELTRLLLPTLRANKGQVILINSGQGRATSPGFGAYSASKHALRAFAEGLRQEEAEHSLRVTSVYPGRVNTDMQRAIWAAQGEDYVPESHIRPESVATAVATAVNATPDAHFVDIAVRPR